MSNIRNSSDNFTSDDQRIAAIETTSDCLTSRAGLHLFVQYLEGIDLLPHLEQLFGSIRKSGKGLSVRALFLQMFCFLFDGTSRHFTHFDELRTDDGYAAILQTSTSQLASSHQIKRFLAGFSFVRNWLFRRALQGLFLWRLTLEQPEVIVLGMDTMILDNSESDVRHGVQPTYKRGVKGFQPLQITWGRFIIDAVFRGGSKHSNDGDTAIKALDHLVAFIRNRYRVVPIVVRMDAGFFDQKIMEALEKLGVGYLIGGKVYTGIREEVDAADQRLWRLFSPHGRNDAWLYQALLDKRKSWTKRRYAIYMKHVQENGQGIFDFARTESIIYTNVSPETSAGRAFIEAGLGDFLNVKNLIGLYHDRGKDELIHRALKDFSPEELPCKRFDANAALYYMRLIAFFLMETFKEDVCQGVVPVMSYATRLRRRLIDIAGKVVRTARRTTLKVSQATYRALNLGLLWDRAVAPPRILWA